MYSGKTVGYHPFGPGERDLCHGAGTADIERVTGTAFQSNDGRVSDWHRTTRGQVGDWHRTRRGWDARRREALL